MKTWSHLPLITFFELSKFGVEQDGEYNIHIQFYQLKSKFSPFTLYIDDQLRV